MGKKRKRKNAEAAVEVAAGSKKSKKIRNPPPPKQIEEDESEDEVEVEAEDEDAGEDNEAEEDEKMDEAENATPDSEDGGSDLEEESGDKDGDELPTDSTPVLPTAADSDLFEDLKLSEKTLNAIKEMGFKTMTSIQRSVRFPHCSSQFLSARPSLLKLDFTGYTPSSGWQRCSRCRQDRFRQDPGVLDPRNRNPLLSSLQAPKRHGRHRRLPDSRACASNFRCRTRADEAPLSNLWYRHWRRQQESRG